MKNIDKIRNMSAEELAEVIDRKKCFFCCDYDRENNKCDLPMPRFDICQEGVRRWLNQEVNPMPEVKAGDLVTDKKGNVYLMDKHCCYKMEENHRPMKIDKDIVTRIDRVSDEGYSCVWRAEQ